MEHKLITMENARGLLSKMEGEFGRALGKLIPTEKFVRIALTSMQRNPKLLECTQTSVLGALMESAQMGLEPDGRHAALVPYGRECKFVPMYQGLVQLAYRSGLVSSVRSQVVRGKDTFELVEGTETRLHHKRFWPTQQAGKLIAAYAIVALRGGELPVVSVLDRDQILAIKEKSPAARRDDSAWSDPTFEPWMWRKTAIKQALKESPQSYELSRALEVDDQYEAGKRQDLPTVEIPYAEVNYVPSDEEMTSYINLFHDAKTLEALQAAKTESDAWPWTPDQIKRLQAAYKPNLERLKEVQA